MMWSINLAAAAIYTIPCDGPATEMNREKRRTLLGQGPAPTGKSVVYVQSPNQLRIDSCAL